MTNAHDPLLDGFVRMIHPASGNIADVGVGAEGLHYASGWVLLTEDNMPPEEEEAGPPAGMSEAAARTAREGTGDDGAGDGGEATPGTTEDKPGGRRHRAGTKTEE
jgi:hypothetical protein